jgi:hypothetical protein
LEGLIAQYGELKERPRIARFQVDRYVAIHGTLSLALWLKGEPARAARVGWQAVEGALGIGHIASVSTVLALWVLPVAFWSGDLDLAMRYKEMLDEHLRLESIQIWVPVSRFFHGAIQFAQGNPTGIELMRIGTADLVKGGLIGRTPMYHTMIAEALLSTGDIVAARASSAKAQLAAQAQGERWCLPEVLRIRGRIELVDDDPVKAERLMLDAISEARQIGARSLELRAALSLADKWTKEGRSAEAQKLLQDIVETFEDAREYADLAKVRARLASLGGRRRIM